MAGDLTNGYWLKAPSPLLALEPTQRYRAMYRNFLEAMAPIREAGIAMYYARGAVDGIWQVVQGNGGATPMTYDPKAQDKRLTNIFPKKRVPAKEMLRGYMVITVDEQTGTVTAQEKCIKDGAMVVTDSFTM